MDYPFETKPFQPCKAYSYIRFSTPEQRKGDSLRRQLEKSEKYAADHGFVLDKSLKLQDLGISGYSGKNRDQGALGAFLKLLDAGKVASGSVLIVESLDRLSREEVTEALELFLGIIRKGIRIATLGDGKEYMKETINANVGDLLYSVSIMVRAHDESLTKAMRLGEAWKQKREKVSDGTEKLTAKCPAWLKLNDNKTEFIVIENRAEILHQMFEMKATGIGVGSIVRELNKTPNIWKPAMTERKRGEGWRESYVKKILNNRAVIGEFQPHRLYNGKRKPEGDPILDYFPAIIDKELFYRVQEQFRQNKNKGGRNGKITNLFSHIVKCGYCGGPMAFVDKGPPPKGGQYLVCDRARRGLACCRTAIKYEEVEELTLIYCRGLKPQDILIENDERANNLLKSKIEGISGELNSINSEIENLADSIGMTPDKRVREIIDMKMIKKLDKKSELEKEIGQLQELFKRTVLSSEETQLTIAALNNLFNSLKTVESEKRTEIRIRLRREIRNLITDIHIYTEGYKFFTADNIDDCLDKISNHAPKGTADYMQFEEVMRQALENPKARRCFRIKYTFSGHRRHWIYPEEAKKLSLSELVNAASSHIEGWEQKASRIMTNYEFK